MLFLNMEKTALVNRARSAQGHMAAIATMMERDAPCREILAQLLAVRGAVRALERELWRGYLLNPNCDLALLARRTRRRKDKARVAD